MKEEEDNLGNGWCYDVEIYPNFFCVTFIHALTEQFYGFEISERRNDLTILVQFLMKMSLLIGFNSIHYDNIIINFLWKRYNLLKNESYVVITNQLKRLNNVIIVDKDNENYPKYKAWKYNNNYKSIDLLMYWSKMLRISKMLSLKALAIAINWPKIQELPYPPDHILKVEEMDEVLFYNFNDVEITKAVMQKLRKEIDLRFAARDRYNLDCLSWDGVKLGLNILIKRYCKRTGLDEQLVRQMRTVREKVVIGDILLPIVSFKESDTSYITYMDKDTLIYEFKSFYGIHQYLKNLTVTTTSEINCRIFLNGVVYDIKSGGLHTVHNPGISEPKSGQEYEDDDVSSYYPSFGAEWTIIPEHLGSAFGEEIKSMKDERLELKSKGLGKSEEAEMLKLALNGGFYGNTNNEYTPMQDMQCMLKITINGQLLLLMLAEWLMEIGAEIDMCNTDGITIIYNELITEQVRELCKKWEVLTKMELESVKYIKVIRNNINNYIAIYKEKGAVKTKLKGSYLTDPPIDLSHDFLVIPKALLAYHKDGIPVEKFIREHKNIYDFCASQKVNRDYQVFWHGKSQQRLNRYYVSKSGAYLYKSKDGKKMSNMLKGFAVQLFNDYEEKENYEIQYEYYISQAKKLIEQVSPSQITMF